MNNFSINLLTNPITLGGILTLRAEFQLIQKIYQKKNFQLIIHHDSSKNDIIQLIKLCFNDIKPYKYIINPTSYFVTDWPTEESLKTSSIFHSTLRLSKLFDIYKVYPRLVWGRLLISKLFPILNNLKKNGKVFSIHLKNQKNNLLEESNVLLKPWQIFFNNQLIQNPNFKFILIGDDAPDSNLFSSNVLSLKELNLSLLEQLAAVHLTDGFLGLASGVCAPAIFSEIPYVIIKHPNHDREEIKLELVNDNQFKFSKEKQELWMCNQEYQIIEKAMNFIIS